MSSLLRATSNAGMKRSGRAPASCSGLGRRPPDLVDAVTRGYGRTGGLRRRNRGISLASRRGGPCTRRRWSGWTSNSSRRHRSQPHLDATCRVLLRRGGVIKSFDGDRVMAIFLGNNKNSEAAKCALQINYTVQKIVKPVLESNLPSRCQAEILSSNDPSVSLCQSPGTDRDPVSIVSRYWSPVSWPVPVASMRTRMSRRPSSRSRSTLLCVPSTRATSPLHGLETRSVTGTSVRLVPSLPTPLWSQIWVTAALPSRWVGRQTHAAGPVASPGSHR